MGIEEGLGAERPRLLASGQADHDPGPLQGLVGDRGGERRDDRAAGGVVIAATDVLAVELTLEQETQAAREQRTRRAGEAAEGGKAAAQRLGERRGGHEEAVQA